MSAPRSAKQHSVQIKEAGLGTSGGREPQIKHGFDGKRNRHLNGNAVICGGAGRIEDDVLPLQWPVGRTILIVAELKEIDRPPGERDTCATGEVGEYLRGDVSERRRVVEIDIKGLRLLGLLRLPNGSAFSGVRQSAEQLRNAQVHAILPRPQYRHSVSTSAATLCWAARWLPGGT